MDPANKTSEVTPQKSPGGTAKRKNTTKDPYCHEGAVEQDKPNQSDNTSMTGQMGHRNTPADLDTLDTDFPEPGENPEHSGE